MEKWCIREKLKFEGLIWRNAKRQWWILKISNKLETMGARSTKSSIQYPLETLVTIVILSQCSTKPLSKLSLPSPLALILYIRIYSTFVLCSTLSPFPGTLENYIAASWKPLWDTLPKVINLAKAFTIPLSFPWKCIPYLSTHQLNRQFISL